MKTARVSVLLAIMLSGTFAAPLAAQEVPGQVFMDGQDDPGTIDRFAFRNYQIRGDFGELFGYDNGFQTFGAFQPVIIQPDQLILWANPRGIIDYTGYFAGNLGAGLRYLDPGSNRIWGGGFWFDTDQFFSQRYDQLSGGIESLGKYIDYRANVYFPTNDNRRFGGTQLTGLTAFTGFNIGVGRSTFFYVPLTGGDFEIGGALPGIGDLGLRAYAGGYYYQGEGVGAGYGVKGRIEALVTQDLWAQVAVQHDKFFGTNVTAALTWYLGTGQTPRWFRRIPQVDRLYQQMERNYRVPVFRQESRDTLLALRTGVGPGNSGGAAGSPIVVLHVDNTAPPGGDGSYEHPLNYLPTGTAANVDIILVRRGDGTTTRYDHGITLNRFQRLLGDGLPHQFVSLGGTFALPDFRPGPFPTITNVDFGGSAVTLANGNEVAAFNIVNPNLNGIVGTNITDEGTQFPIFNIHHVNISGANSGGAAGVGAGIFLTNATGTGSAAGSISDSTFTGNNAAGIRVDNLLGGTLNLSLARISATLNGTSGVTLTQTGGTQNLTVTDSTFSNNSDDGFQITANGGATYTALFDRIVANNNNNPVNPPPPPPTTLGSGLSFTADGLGTTATVTVQHSTLDNNGLNGMTFNTSNGSLLNANILDNDSSISNNLGGGVIFNAESGSTVNALFTNNTINGNGLFGIGVTATDATFNLTAGTFSEDTNFNGILDAGEDANGNGILDDDGNLFDQNGGAAIAFTLRDTASGTISLFANTITRTQDDATGSAIYNGQAIDIRLTGSTVASNATATLTSGLIDHNLIGSNTNPAFGNVGGGINVFADQQTNLTNLLIGNADAVADNGNIIRNNGGDAVHFERNNQATVDNIDIVDNNLSDNTGDGIELISRNSGPNTGDDRADYDIRENIIETNTGRGVAFRVEADAQILADMSDNRIRFNGADGVQLTELVGSPFDNRSLSGTWVRNTITNNSGDGIDLGGNTDNLSIGINTSLADGNLISQNANSGILVSGSGTLDILFNTITLNGASNPANTGGGIRIAPTTFNTIAINDNLILSNTGDGLEILSPGPFIVTIDGNRNVIRNNTGRGIDILNRASANSSAGTANGVMSFDSNEIIGNGLEGVYVVNTASATQNQTNLANVAFNTDGAVNSLPRLTFDFTNNRIEGNGLLNTTGSVGANGLLIRVGSSDGGRGVNDDGGFFAEGRGGVGATVTGNIFSGNLGDDVYFDSFVSTVDPNTGTTWDATTVNNAGYQSDPLARLDLTFTGNSFDSADTNNVGGAYTNADGTFKSRLNTATPAGPFTSATRPRNITRLAGRFGLPPGNNALFLYPGIGQSTFRLLGVAAPGNVGVFDPGNVGTYANGGFLIDDFYLSPFTDANGVGPYVPLNQMPYGWNVNSGGLRPQ